MRGGFISGGFEAILAVVDQPREHSVRTVSIREWCRLVSENRRAAGFFAGWHAQKAASLLHMGVLADRKRGTARNRVEWDAALQDALVLWQLVSRTADESLLILARKLIDDLGPDGVRLSTNYLHDLDGEAFYIMVLPHGGQTGDRAHIDAQFRPDLINGQFTDAGVLGDLLGRMRQLVLGLGRRLEQRQQVEMAAALCGLAHAYATRRLKGAAEIYIKGLVTLELLPPETRAAQILPAAAPIGPEDKADQDRMVLGLRDLAESVSGYSRPGWFAAQRALQAVPLLVLDWLKLPHCDLASTLEPPNPYEYPWDPSNPDYIPVSTARVQAGDFAAASTISKYLGNKGNIRFMRKGQRCRVHRGDFLAFHGKWQREHPPRGSI
jgi:hypothetical protein